MGSTVATRWRLGIIMTAQRLQRRLLTTIAPVSKPTIIYDSELKGFGLRLTPPSARNPKGRQSWIVEYRPGSGGRNVAKKRFSLGGTEALSPEQAREMAKTMLASVRLGADPTAKRNEERASKSIQELEPLYSSEHKALRKPRTVKLYEGYWNVHILPALGASTARMITRKDILRLHRTIGAAHKTTANRVVALLAHFFSWAAEHGHSGKGDNPCVGIDRFAESGRERYLSADELARLGAAIRLAEETGVAWHRADGAPPSKHLAKDPSNRRTKVDGDAADAIRLLLLTGARLREILHLKWCDFDRQRGLLLLPDSKTGKKTIVLGRSAIEVLNRLQECARAPVTASSASERPTPLSVWVFPGRSFSAPRADLKRPWTAITREAGLTGLRIHDLRHSFASVGAGAGLGLPILGRLLGHASPATTARYAHLDADPLRIATDLISGTLASAMMATPSQL